jgi:hypothetical protein
MDTSLWVAHLKRRLSPKLEGVQLGDYATAVSANLVVVLSGFSKGWTPEQVASEIYAIELAALGPKKDQLPSQPE